MHYCEYFWHYMALAAAFGFFIGAGLGCILLLRIANGKNSLDPIVKRSIKNYDSE